MCEKAVDASPWQLKYVPDQYKTHETCDKVVRDDRSSLRYVPNRFVTGERVCLWYDNSDYYADDEDNFFKWYEYYKKRKAQKASIKEELLQNKLSP